MDESKNRVFFDGKLYTSVCFGEILRTEGENCGVLSREG